MGTLQTLLVILDGQPLTAGYLPTFGNGTALETAMGLMDQFNHWVLFENPLAPPVPLLTPAWVGSLGVGQDAIFLAGVDGNLDLSQTPPPAYTFA